MRLDVLCTGVHTRFFTQLMPPLPVTVGSPPLLELIDVLIMSGIGDGLPPLEKSGEVIRVGGEGGVLRR
jgi:hypothetical protein